MEKKLDKLLVHSVENKTNLQNITKRMDKHEEKLEDLQESIHQFKGGVKVAGGIGGLGLIAGVTNWIKDIL